jgi:hypothetical protein
MKIAFLISIISFSVFSKEIKLNDYEWHLTDILSKGLTRNSIFSKMDRKFINPSESICSNRALMWANDFQRLYGINSAKIFLFYTKPKKERLIQWWYHVAPVINENGVPWVVDAGFAGFIDGPISIQTWLSTFSLANNCKQIDANETDLIELIFTERVFPKQTRYGSNECYYKIVPHTLWTPGIVAQDLLGKDHNGRPVRIDSTEINPEELYQACIEATTSKIEYALGVNRKKCKEYAGIKEED